MGNYPEHGWRIMACPKCGGPWGRQSGLRRCKKCGYVYGSQVRNTPNAETQAAMRERPSASFATTKELMKDLNS
jgi:uncharacterized Zn finger protein (UPF0148 family)